MSYICETPILLIFFNRPTAFAQVFEKVREAKPKTLILAQDGARNERDHAGIQACRKIAESVDWNCEVIRDYSSENLGCGMKPFTAITNALQKFEKIIILEDDCIPSQSFFRYCDELLERYKNDDRIAYISGLNHFERWDCGDYDYFFSRAASIGAWATWQNRWMRYYGTALSICNVWVFVLAAIIDSFNPIILELHNTDEKGFIKKNIQLYSIVFYVSMAVGILYTVFAGIGIRILYGEAYMPAVTPLRIITWYVAFSYLGVARNAWVVSENKQKYLIPINAGSAVMNVILNMGLIPLLGTSGAAVASLVTQISTIFIMPLFIKDMRQNVSMMVNAVLLRGFR